MYCTVRLFHIHMLFIFQAIQVWIKKEENESFLGLYVCEIKFYNPYSRGAYISHWLFREWDSSIRLIENSCRISDLGNSHLIIFFSSTNSKFSFKEFSERSKANTLSDIPIKRPSQKHIIQMNLQKKSLLIFIYRKLNSKGDALYI